MKRFKYALLATAVLLTTVSLSSAWWVKGHESITEAAAKQLPDEMPAFFRAAGKHLAHFAGDPDRWKNKECKALKASIEGDHYIDLEDLGGKSLPSDSRYKGVKMIIEDLKKEPARVGMLPYAIEEGYEKLACAFYDYRQDPTNEAIRMKCLVYAGNLAHFTTDASMPLHTTIHFDGRVQADGTKLQKGIHAKVDAFPEKFKLTPEEIARDLVPVAQDNVWDYTDKFLKESFKHIDRCFELDAAGAFETPTAESREFILGRCRAGAQFTMDIWLSAWKRSLTLGKHY